MGKDMFGRRGSKSKLSPDLLKLVDEAIKNKTIMKDTGNDLSYEGQKKQKIAVADWKLSKNQCPGCDASLGDALDSWGRKKRCAKCGWDPVDYQSRKDQKKAMDSPLATIVIGLFVLWVLASIFG